MPFSPSGIDMAAKRLPRTGIMTSGYGRTKAAAFIIIDTNKT